MAALKRQPAVLVAPGITFLAVALILVVARFYEHLPTRFPECGYLKATNLPCPACGGTRAMQSLATGNLHAAWHYHPLFTAVVFASPLWLFLGLIRYFRMDSMPEVTVQNRRLKWGVIVFAILLFFNWLYLILFLP